MNAPLEDCFNVNFGASVGRFKLGTHVNDILEMFSNEYPRMQLEVSFSDDDDANGSPSERGAASRDIRVNVPQWGLRLRFQRLSQRLFLIDIHNFNVMITFNINGCLIRGQEQATTFSHLQKALGPTFPGKFVDDEGHYLLTFAGVGLLFRVPTRFQSLYADGTMMLPIILPDKSSAVLERVYVYGKDFDMEHPELFPDVLDVSVRILLQHQQQQHASSSPLSGTHLRLLHSSAPSPASVSDEGGTGTGTGTGRETSRGGGGGRDGCVEEGCLVLGMSPQDVVSSLGSPDFASLSPQHAEPFIHKYEYRRLGKTVFVLDFLTCSLKH